MAAATSRLFSLLGTPNLLHPHTTTTTTVNLRRFSRIRHPSKLFPAPTLRFRRYVSSSSTVVEDDTVITASGSSETTENCQKHPWPEWVGFVDCLKAKGYLVKGAQSDNGSEVVIYNDMSILKDACLSFGRDRFDILRLLSRQDMQTVVEKGCPNIHRKTVNSGKRIRAHLQLNEGDVCGKCILRGTCDRANVILKEFESEVRTVDVVRILLNYALSSAKELSGTELVEASARKLLLELTELSNTTIDPDLPKPAAITTRKQRSGEGKPVELRRPAGTSTRKAQSFVEGDKPAERRKPSATFSRKDRFVEGDGSQNVEMKRGDWMCPKCQFMNFARNIRCLKCKTEGPRQVATDNVEMKKGDWSCPSCHFINFASNTKCLRCREKRQMRPGDWECPTCDFLNFNGNVVCRKCRQEQPRKLLEQKLKTLK